MKDVEIRGVMRQRSVKCKDMSQIKLFCIVSFRSRSLEYTNRIQLARSISLIERTSNKHTGMAD